MYTSGLSTKSATLYIGIRTAFKAQNGYWVNDGTANIVAYVAGASQSVKIWYSSIGGGSGSASAGKLISNSKSSPTTLGTCTISVSGKNLTVSQTASGNKVISLTYRYVDNLLGHQSSATQSFTLRINGYGLQTYVNYNRNGYTGGTLPSSSGMQDYPYNTTVKSFSPTGPTKGGAAPVFQFWTTADYKNKAASDIPSKARYKAGTGLRVSTYPLVLYAICSYPSRTVKFNGNGATGGSVANITKAAGSSFKFPANKYTKTGYTASIWYTDKSGGTRHTEGSTGTVSNTTYYVHWTAKTFVITFDKQGGTGGDNSVSITYNTTALADVNIPTRTGYAFQGYYTEPNGKGTSRVDAAGK